jgi:hypothetical protein
MNRINSEYGNDEYHLWNVFKDSKSKSSIIDSGDSNDTII